MKSKNLKTSSSGYEMELFVVQFLIFVYGEKILEPYFYNNSNAFFNQFKKIGISPDLIYQLDSMLQSISQKKEIHQKRYIHLVLSDLFPNIISENIEFFKNLKLNIKTSVYIDKSIAKIFNNEKTKKLLEELEDYINSLKYKYQNPQKEEINNYYTEEYENVQKKEFSKILDILIFIGQNQNISFGDISNFIQENLAYKSEEFNQLYKSTIDEKLKISKKKR